MAEVDEYSDTPETAPVIGKTQRAYDAAKIRELRNSSVFKKLREDFRQECARTNAPCHLCNGTIDYQLSYPHPYGFECDHAATVKEHPELLMDPLNLRASHRDCNQARGSDEPRIDLGEPSETW